MTDALIGATPRLMNWITEWPRSAGLVGLWVLFAAMATPEVMACRVIAVLLENVDSGPLRLCLWFLLSPWVLSR